MANKDHIILNGESFQIPDGWEEVPFSNRTSLEVGGGAPVPAVPVDRFASGAISSTTFGLQTDQVNSQLPGHVPSFRVQPPQPSSVAAVNSGALSVTQRISEQASFAAVLADTANQNAIRALSATWQGTWSSLITYALGAIVEFSGTVYVSLVNQNLNFEPDTHAAQWRVTGQVSFQGAWSAITTYSIGAIVDSGGQLYISLINGNLNNIPVSSPADWQATGSPNTSVFLGVWNSGTAYVLGNQITYSGTSGNAYYIALASNTNSQPDTHPANWQQIGAPNSYVFLSAYNGATAYVPGNQVSYLGSYWICISASTGNAPGVGSSFWQQIGQAAILLQNWSSSIAYTLGMEVVFNGDIYKCILANTNQTPPNATYWYLEGSANSTTQGKNALFNPGFESNLGGYPVVTTVSTVGAYVVDGWNITELTNTTFQSTYLNNGLEHGGNLSLSVRLVNASVSIPSDNIFKNDRVMSAPIPVTAGSIFMLSGWIAFNLLGGLTVPAGVTTLGRLAYNVYDQNGNLLSQQVPFADITAAQGYTQVSIQLTVAATYGGTPPSYIRIECGGFIKNNSGSAYVTTVSQAIDVTFDDLSVVFVTNLGVDTNDGPSAFAARASGLSYVPTTNPLTATDAGSNATISVASFNLLTSAQGTISYNSGSITALSYSTLYYVYLSDLTLAGGTVTYLATTTKTNPLNGAALFYIGSITTPGSGGAATTGNGDGGVSVQQGLNQTGMPGTQVFTFSNSTATWTNQTNTMKGNANNFGQLAYNASSQVKSSTYVLSNFAIPGSGYYRTITLNVPTAVPTNSLNAAGTKSTIQYSLDGGITFNSLRTTTQGQTYAKTDDTVTLSVTQNLAAVQVQYVIEATGTDTSGTIDLNIYPPYIAAAI